MFAAANIGNVTPSAGGDAAGSSIKSKLKALKELFDEGLLNEDEYKQKKQELMKEL
ncbi:SHOCT domain-containing protein [Chitinophaga agrisoli]|uniref:SHOCT domain-containing protein n=1 Tax=Chitinophaga agrisoli TaxID=2607653 RepID=A0A5B2VJM1_9BACT|nr:SHOCT domain-containing protein [Chitinophaga agrisoli]KAA2238419.1 SHOCT domain-containing protein [Chitinophaga agrisoli]